MPVSIFDLFKIGIGPSSSHTVGPMRIALAFAQALIEAGMLNVTMKIEVHLYGSLALTGRGHATDRAVVLGLMGFSPDAIDPHTAEMAYVQVLQHNRLSIAGRRNISFSPAQDIVFHMDHTLSEHPNGMRLVALDEDDTCVLDKTSFSVGGGFVVSADEIGSAVELDRFEWPYGYKSAGELLAICRKQQLSIADVALVNETKLRPQHDVLYGLE